MVKNRECTDSAVGGMASEEPDTVTGMKRTTEKNLMVFSGRAHPELAEEVTHLLGTGLVPTSAYEFANSEIYVRYEESVRGCDAFVIPVSYTHLTLPTILLV